MAEKQAIVYWTPGEDREPRRTRFLSSKNMIKKKKKALKVNGHMTKVIPRSEGPKPNRPIKLKRSVINRDVANHWSFLFSESGMICIKNGSKRPLHKLP